MVAGNWQQVGESAEVENIYFFQIVRKDLVNVVAANIATMQCVRNVDKVDDWQSLILKTQNYVFINCINHVYNRFLNFNFLRLVI